MAPASAALPTGESDGVPGDLDRRRGATGYGGLNRESVPLLDLGQAVPDRRRMITSAKRDRRPAWRGNLSEMPQARPSLPGEPSIDLGAGAPDGGRLLQMTGDHEREHGFAEALAEARHPQTEALPLKRDVAAFVDGLLGILFPQLSEERGMTAEEIQAALTLVRRDLRDLLGPLEAPPRSAEVAGSFMVALPALYEQIRLDGEAILAGDPAAESLDEVISAYPGFLAIAIHRIAHEIHRLGVRVLPRLLTEVAHTRTGIDIHPGAAIGRGLCIDHGTGVVIGETAVIGDEVKLYQGVTLGALSVAKSAAGTKRHPTIGDRVVIYANATVLGGDTEVGHDSVVGGNVWLTHSVPSHSVVYQSSQVRVRSAMEGFEFSDFVI